MACGEVAGAVREASADAAAPQENGREASAMERIAMKVLQPAMTCCSSCNRVCALFCWADQ